MPVRLHAKATALTVACQSDAVGVMFFGASHPDAACDEPRRPVMSGSDVFERRPAGPGLDPGLLAGSLPGSLPQGGQRFLAHGRKAILPGAPGLLHCLAKGATRIYMFPCISKAMEGIMQVAKWGNSLAVRLPAQLVQEMGLKAGDEIQITRAEPGLAVSRLPSPEEVLADLRRFRGRLPASQRLSRDDANAR